MEDVVFEIDTELKERAEKLFSEYGLTLEEATILFVRECIQLGKFPFEVDTDLLP